MQRPRPDSTTDDQAAALDDFARDLDAMLADEPGGCSPLVLVGIEAAPGDAACDTDAAPGSGAPDTDPADATPLVLDAERSGSDALIGFRSPPSWSGLVVVAEGWAWTSPNRGPATDNGCGSCTRCMCRARARRWYESPAAT